VRKLDPQTVFVQYRNEIYPNDPVINRKYTITHSDKTAEMFVFVAEAYAEDQINGMRDEVRVAWEKKDEIPILIGSVLIDGDGNTRNAKVRNMVFYYEMPTALQALRQADRFLFMKYPELDKARVEIHFISSSPEYDKTYDFGMIGIYQESLI